MDLDDGIRGSVLSPISNSGRVSPRPKLVPPLAYPLSYVLVLNAIPRQPRRASWKLLLRWNPRSHDSVDATLCLCASSSSLEVETWLLCIITALSLPRATNLRSIDCVYVTPDRFELARIFDSIEMNNRRVLKSDCHSRQNSTLEKS